MQTHIDFTQEEIWKDIPKFEGVYQASNLGRIKSLPRIITRNGYQVNVYQKILKQSIKSGGYATVSLCNGREYKMTVHQIIASAWLPLIEGKNEINHINGIKTDNRVVNIERCNRSENIKHAHRTGLHPNVKGELSKMAKIYLNTETGIYYVCSKNALESLGQKISRSYFVSMTNNSRVNITSFIQA